MSHRLLSIRKKGSGPKSPDDSSRHHFSMATLRGMQQPEMSRKLFKLIKSESNVIGAYETAGRERIAIASQLSDWGEGTGDDGISDISDKLGVLLSELGEQEDSFAQNLEDSRAILKQIRNMEGSVQPSRDAKTKTMDEIAKLKQKEPESAKIAQLEQELVRAEAQNLVAEAQLTNVTRQKVKEAYDLHFAATIERAEKQILLARQGRRLLNLIDDTPIVPGSSHPAYEGEAKGHEILSEAEGQLRAWTPQLEPVESKSGALSPHAAGTTDLDTNATIAPPAVQSPTEVKRSATEESKEGTHLAEKVEAEKAAAV